jgi:hypothetical protein
MLRMIVVLLAALSAACRDEPTGVAPPTQQALSAEERVLNRSRSWVHDMCNGLWSKVSTYHYPRPKVRSGPSPHSEPAEPQLIYLDEDIAHVRGSAVWKLLLSPSEGCGSLPPLDSELFQLSGSRVEWIETWDYVDGDWYMRLPAQRPSEFFEAHPELSPEE